MKTSERYSRQTVLQGFGTERQEMLSRASVLVIGAGGLGCPALQYLAGAGVGNIGIADGDRVGLSNLHRQVLYNTDDIGRLKAEAAAQKLTAANPEISISIYPVQVSSANCVEMLRNYDIIMDCSDNFPTRYMVNDACVILAKPLVFAAVSGWEGQLAVFHTDSLNLRANYRDLFPQQPKAGEIPSCEENGIIGVLPGIIGTMQAAEAIKLITGTGEPLINRLLNYDLRSQQVYTIAITPAPKGSYQLPSDLPAFRATLYEHLTPESNPGVRGINGVQLNMLLSTAPALVIDVRELNEEPELNIEHIRVPLSARAIPTAPVPGQNVIFVCQHGMRSMAAARHFMSLYPDHQQVYSLSGGIAQWVEHHQ